MADRTTDGTSSSGVDPASGGSPWDSVFAEARSFGDTVTTDTDATASEPSPSTTHAAERESSAGAHPGSPETPPSPTGDDGTADPAAPAPATSAAPADSATTAEPDPLATAEPFTFTVNGQSETVDGAYRIPGEGLYVPEDKVPQFQLMASRSVSLDRQNRELYEQHRALEKLSEWPQKAPDGTTQMLTGAPAIEARTLEYASALAELKTIKAVLADPYKLASLLTLNEQTQEFGLNEQAMRDLQREAGLLQREVSMAVRDRFRSLTAPSAPAAPSAAAPFDAKTSAPAIVNYAITQAPDADALGKLTAEDRTLAAQLAPKYVRAATPADVQANPALRVGEPILEPEFLVVLRGMAARSASASRLAETSTIAGKFNAGMKQGTQAGKPAPRAAAPTTPPMTGRNAPAPKKPGASANDIWSELVEDARSVTL